MNNWQGNNATSFVPNNPNIPYIVPTPIYTKPLPLYHAPSDPRFKQNVTYEKPQITTVENIDQRNDDELWIETYLSKIGKININLHSKVEIIPQKPTVKTTHKKSLKIHVAKSVLHRCINLLEQLEKLESYLRENVATISSTEWKQKTVEIGQQKDEFSALLSQFDDSSVLEQLHKALKKRKCKRLLAKQRKINYKKNLEETAKKRELIDKNINQWLEKVKEDVKRVKREEYLKKDADCILSEVTKKKSDARKQLSLLSALIKLRNVREKVALANGEKLNMEDSNAFKQNTEKLQKMWTKALDTYGIEEQGLKVMLESSTADEVHSTSNLEEKKIITDWETIMFGPKIIPCDAYWGLTCAEKDIRTFIALRKSWDTFLVSDDNKEGSQIPIGWVLPDVSNSWLPTSKK